MVVAGFYNKRPTRSGRRPINRTSPSTRAPCDHHEQPQPACSLTANGFTDAAHEKATKDGRLMAIFVDAQDLYPVLDGIVDLRQLLTRKLRHAADKGEPMYRFGT